MLRGPAEETRKFLTAWENNYKCAVSNKVKQEADTPGSCKYTATAQENTENSISKDDIDSAAIENTVKPTTDTNVAYKDGDIHPAEEGITAASAINLETPMFLILMNRMKYVL